MALVDVRLDFLTKIESMNISLSSANSIPDQFLIFHIITIIPI